MIKCSIGICVYNEEKNLTRLLNSILAQRLETVKIDEVIIILSGCTDKTPKIAKSYSLKDKRFKLLYQKKREGKSSAVNLFISKAKNEILMLAGGDLFLPPKTVEKLISKFKNTEIGMTGGHPVPLNNISNGFTGFAVNMTWGLHHRIALKNPKMGEVIAFRKIFKRIPHTHCADEASIEPLIIGQGYEIKYVSDAIIFNKGPDNLKEYLTQRKRNHVLHLVIKYEQGYKVSTLNGYTIIRALLSYLKDNFGLKFFFFSLLVISLEVYTRFLAWWDYRAKKRKYTVWQIIESTKNLEAKN